MYTEKYWISWVESYELFALGRAFAVVKFTNVHHVLLSLLYQILTLCLFFRMSYFHKKWNTDVFSICILCPINPPLSHYSTYKVFRDLTPNASTQNQRSSSALICALICVPPLSCNTTLIRDILHQVVKSYWIIVSHIYILKAISSWYIWSLGYILGYIHTRAIINIEMIREDMRVIDHPADRPMWR